MDEELVREATRFKKSIGGLLSSRRRFAPAQRSEGRRLCQRMREAGSTHDQIVESLGVSRHTVQRWLKTPSRDGKPASAGALVPVVVRSERAEACCAMFEATTASHQALVLISPTGWRVEGLQLDELADLLTRRSA